MNQVTNTRTYLSGAVHQSRDWQDQLKEIGAVLKSSDDADSGLAVEDEAHNDVVAQPLEYSPIKGFEVSSALCNKKVESGVSNESLMSIKPETAPIGFEIGAVDSRPRVTSSVENVDEASMSSNREDQFSDDENRSNFKKDRDYTERTEARYDHEEDPEEVEARKLRQAKDEKVRKGLMWGILSVGTVALVTASVAVVQGLLGNHKSNIMNL